MKNYKLKITIITIFVFIVSCFILSANYYQKTNQTFKKLQPTNVRGILLNNKTDNSYLELKKSLIEKYNDILSNKLQSLSCEYKEEIKTILGSDYILYIESMWHKCRR